MYCEHFGLRLAPFSIAPDPRFLYMSLRHREALAHLRYGLQAGGGFVLLTGDIGSGKTTLCRSLLAHTLPQVQLAYVLNPRLDTIELLQTVCEEFRQPLPTDSRSLKALVSTLNAFLLQAHADGQRCVLIIDEAQNLSVEVLEQLRLLTNLETNEHKLLQIILIGQPELRNMLDGPELEQLAQRVIARYHLEALDPADTRLYVQHRLTVAGLTGPLPFTEQALHRLHRHTDGIPRRINLLCDRAMLGAFGRRQPQVDTALVDLAAREVLGRATQAPRFALSRKQGSALVLVTVFLVAAWWQVNPQSIHETVVSPEPAAATDTTWLLAGAATTPSSDSVSQHSEPALAELPDDLDNALRALGTRWGLQLPAKDVCEAALTQGVQCFRTERLTLDGLRQLDRPGLLYLREKGVARWIQADAIEGGLLTMRTGDQRWTLPLDALPQRWRGEYTTFWRLPPGQTTRVYVAAPRDPAGRWLSKQLDELQPASSPNNDWNARLRAFQQRYGLHGDGKAIPSTFLLVNRLSNVDEPRLMMHNP